MTEVPDWILDPSWIRLLSVFPPGKCWVKAISISAQFLQNHHTVRFSHLISCYKLYLKFYKGIVSNTPLRKCVPLLLLYHNLEFSSKEWRSLQVCKTNFILRKGAKFQEWWVKTKFGRFHGILHTAQSNLPNLCPFSKNGSGFMGYT